MDFQRKMPLSRRCQIGDRKKEDIINDVGAAIPTHAADTQPKNKKTTFVDTGTAVPAQLWNTEPNNKRIVFDKSYISNSDVQIPVTERVISVTSY